MIIAETGAMDHVLELVASHTEGKCPASLAAGGICPFCTDGINKCKSLCQ